MDFTKLLFRPRTPEGFRLATFDETTKKYSLLRTRHILNGSECLRLFDGVLCDGKETFDGDSWPYYMLVVPETPTPRNSLKFSFLRKELYSGAKLSDERKKIALRWSCLLQDIEAIYCLLMCDSEAKSKLKDHFHKSIESEMKEFSPNFLIIVKILFGIVEIGDAESYTKSLDYALTDNRVPENAIAIAKIVLDEIRQAESSHVDVDGTVYSLIQTVATKGLKEDTEAKRIGILTKLLSEWRPSEWSMLSVCRNDVILPNFKEILIEAIRRDYEKLVDDLLHLKDKKEVLDDLLSSQDSQSKKDEVDTSGDNLLHCAARGAYGENIVKVFGEKCEKFINLRNQKGLTPLHVAAMHDNKALITSLNILPLPVVNEALKATDYAGRIPLHLAASEGTEETVKLFLEMRSDPFKRDLGGKTAVHHAVKNKNGNETAKKIVEVLLRHLKCNKKRSLLLCISAAGTGTAEQMEGLNADIKEFLKKKKAENRGVNILEEAAGSKDARLTWELLNRSANVQSVQDKKAFTFVTKVIEKFSKQSTDQPTLVDTLGRNVLAECISAHFLNPYIKSPITVSISGGSGSGKTSLLQQIESYLLITAAQLAVPYLWWNPEKFDDWTNKPLSSKGKYMYRKIEDGVFNLLEKGNYRDFKEEVKTSSLQEKQETSVVYLLKAYLREHKEVYKSLARMDFNQLIKEEENESVYKSQGQSLGAVPRVLTVNFNASSYRGSTEAWAGLAVEITKEIEGSMTWAQLMSTRWRNSRSRHRQDFYLGFIFPAVVLAFVGAWVAWAAWKLLDRAGPSELKDLKYGSVAATVITIVWSVLGKVVSVFKPISTQMTGYFSSPDYSQQLGYQQTVISDIKFLKKEIGQKPCFVFSFLAGEVCKSWWGLWKENIKGTSVPDYGSAPEDKLRIIAFVDDLDQCEETEILRVLWAINLVFRVCEINVILTMDKATIQTAYKKSSSAQDRDFVDNFISKIVQLPVSIPDPKDEDWVQFLDTELLREDIYLSDFEEHMDSVDQPSNTQSEIESASENREQEGDRRKDIESGERTIKWEGWCITFVHDWLTPRGKGTVSWFLSFMLGILQSLWFAACNLRNENERNEAKSRKDEGGNDRKILVRRACQLRDMLMPSNTDEETITFNDLKCYSTGIQKLPREWKNFMNYHKFARNVISRMAALQGMRPNTVGWEVEFVVWTFVCSQWKHQINYLIQDWYKIAYERDRHGNAKLKSSLKQIVADYIRLPKWEEQRACQVRFRVEEQLGEGTGKQVFIVSNSEELSSVGSVKKELECWENLYTCLDNVHDVSIESIRCFQDFRYHCDARNLISKIYKPKRKTRSELVRP